MMNQNKIDPDEMDWMWDFCSAFPDRGGKIIRRLKDQGLSWKDLNQSAQNSLKEVYDKIYKDVMENGLLEDENN